MSDVVSTPILLKIPLMLVTILNSFFWKEVDDLEMAVTRH